MKYKISSSKFSNELENPLDKINLIEIQHMLSSLQERGRGCCGYGDEYDYDFGCFDWEVVCTPEGGYTVDYDPDFDWGDYNGDCYEYRDDIDRYHTVYLDREYNYAQYEYDYMCSDRKHYDPLRTWGHDKIDGSYAVGDILNGDAPLIMDEKTMEALNLTSTCISAHEIALSAIQQASQDGTLLASIGKMARGVGVAGSIVGAYVAACDLNDGHQTPQDWGQAVGAGLGLTATILGLTVSAPVSVPLGIGAMVVTFFSYTLDDSADHQQTQY